MKKLLGFLLLLNSFLFAQYDVSASMGLDFRSAASFRDYVNTSFAYGNQIGTFKSAVSFNVEGDYKLSKNFALGLEYNILIDSYNTPFGIAGIYEISYNIMRPSLIAYYLIPGEGYQFKFGGGVGYRSVSLSETIISKNNYSSSGIGFVLKAEGNTLLSKNFYALIGGNFRYDSIGDVQNNGNYIVNKSTKENLNMNSISFGIYLGVTLTF